MRKREATRTPRQWATALMYKRERHGTHAKIHISIFSPTMVSCVYANSRGLVVRGRRRSCIATTQARFARTLLEQHNRLRQSRHSGPRHHLVGCLLHIQAQSVQHACTRCAACSGVYKHAERYSVALTTGGKRAATSTALAMT
jgi:hypothetical protein